MRKNLSILAAVAGAAAMATSAQAGFGLSAVVTDATVDGSMQTAVISLTGDAGAALQAISGLPPVSTNDMFVDTGNGSNLFNSPTATFGPLTLFTGSSPFAAPDLSAFGFNDHQYDSGFLAYANYDPGDGEVADTSASPGFTAEFGSMAFGGALDSTTNASIFDGDPGTLALIGGGLNVLRLTWDRNTTAHFGAMFSIVTPLSGVDQVYLTIDLPAVPAPGAMALLGLAGICGVSRRRRKA